jgi:predicted ester cyclase
VVGAALLVIERGGMDEGDAMVEEHGTVAAGTNGTAQDARYARPTSMSVIGPDPAAIPRAANGEKTRTMAGFDDFTDIVHYIEKSTYHIWDLKNIGLIYRFYTPTTVVHTSDGDTFGRDAVIANSLTKMAAFPDIRDFIEDTIWTGNDQDGYRTSMRWTWTARNTGYSIYGPPTGRRVVVSGIANCVVRGENIIEEWVAYNELSLIRQLGLDVQAVLRDQLARQPIRDEMQRAAGEVDRLVGQGPPALMPPKRGADFDIEDFVRRATHEVWNWRLFGKIPEYFAPNYLCHTASDRELYGTGDYTQDVLARIAAFPDAVMQIDDLYWNDDGHGRYRVAVLWTMLGTHTGPSVYGPPTGRRVRVMGITQYHVAGGRFQQEWTEYGEFNLMKQLYAPLEGAANPTSAAVPA